MDVKRAAGQRHERNRYSRTNRPHTADADEIGIAGEIAFATRVLGIEGYTPDTMRRTPGYQFHIVHGAGLESVTVKVTTSRTPGRLFVREGKVNADIYVLAGIDGDADPERVWWVGWATADQVRAADVVTPNRKGNYVTPAHAVNRGSLHAIASLCQRIGATGPDAQQFAEPATADGDPDSPGVQGRLF